MDENLIPQARIYATRHNLEIADAPGSGKDGIILIAKNKGKPGESAVKALNENDAYLREKRVYERLKANKIKTVLGFNVRQWLGSSDDLQAVEMTIVLRPFDFDECLSINNCLSNYSDSAPCRGKNLRFFFPERQEYIETNRALLPTSSWPGLCCWKLPDGSGP